MKNRIHFDLDYFGILLDKLAGYLSTLINKNSNDGQNLIYKLKNPFFFWLYFYRKFLNTMKVNSENNERSVNRVYELSFT